MYMSPIWQGVIQMYSVVLGLEVLGNPVGFVRGLKKGTVGLFYHPLQVYVTRLVFLVDSTSLVGILYSGKLVVLHL